MSTGRKSRHALRVGVLVLALPVGASAIYLGSTALSLIGARVSHAAAVRASTIVVVAAGVPPRQPLHAPPPASSSAVGLDPNQVVYTGIAFRPDAIRILDVAALQVSLSRYRATTGRYPESLDALFPAYAPLGPNGRPLSTPPVDPETSAPYTYRSSRSGLDYQLSAKLSNGHTFSGFPQATS